MSTSTPTSQFLSLARPTYIFSVISLTTSIYLFIFLFLSLFLFTHLFFLPIYHSDSLSLSILSLCLFSPVRIYNIYPFFSHLLFLFLSLSICFCTYLFFFSLYLILYLSMMKTNPFHAYIYLIISRLHSSMICVSIDNQTRIL